MKPRKKLNDLRIGGLKCLFAIVLPLAMITHAQAAVDVLDLWNFNNSAGSDGSFPGVYYTSPGATDAAYYDDPSKSIINASSGIFATSSKVDVSTLGVMGYSRRNARRMGNICRDHRRHRPCFGCRDVQLY